jgi:hypothetical protein
VQPDNDRQPAASDAPTPGGNIVERCVSCHFYDRHNGTPNGGKSPNAGQCRKGSPHLNPMTAKSYMIEGVWPTVRDDDWCGEWKALVRRVDPGRIGDVLGSGGASAPMAGEGQPRATVISATPIHPPLRPVSVTGSAAPGAASAPAKFAFAPARGD